MRERIAGFTKLSSVIYNLPVMIPAKPLVTVWGWGAACVLFPTAFMLAAGHDGLLSAGRTGKQQTAFIKRVWGMKRLLVCAVPPASEIITLNLFHLITVFLDSQRDLSLRYQHKALSYL